MPKFVVEREIPGAGKFSAQELQAISQKSCGVLRGMGHHIQPAWRVRTLPKSGLRSADRVVGATMKIGVAMFVTGTSIDVVPLARRCKELGFESLWVPEHTAIPVRTNTPWSGSPDGVVPPYYSQMVDPFVALARASAVTTTLKLGTGICLVPERHPILLAKEVASLNYFSGGRFLFGIGPP